MKKIFYSLILVLVSSIAFAQNVAINTDGTVSDPSAMLDVKSTSKGVLVPRMTTTQRTAITSPATGLLVFDTNTNSFWFYNGSAWTNLTTSGGGSASWDVNGSSINNNNTGNVGIGTNTPAYKLDVAGRMRVKTGTLGTQNTSSGVWMEDYRDGSDRIFFGMQDSIRAGFFGGGTGGAGWKFNFNAKNGFVGLGKNASTYRLEIDDNNGSNLGLYKNGIIGGGFKLSDSTMEIFTKNGNNLCVPFCPATDLVLMPPVATGLIGTPGNVGIGINNPLQKLSVNGSMGVYDNNTLIGSLGKRGTNFLINAKTGNFWDGGSDLILQSRANVDEFVGNVGIGIDNPYYKLSVDGNIGIYNNNDMIGYITPTFNINKFDLLINAKGGAGNVMPSNISLQAGGSTGNVGIGTFGPSEKLDVYGNIKLTGEVNKQATGTANLLPLLYGNVKDDGTLLGSTGNFTVEKNMTGKYKIILPFDVPYAEQGQYIILVTCRFLGYATAEFGAPNIIYVNTLIAQNNNQNIANYDLGFSILVYKL